MVEAIDAIIPTTEELQLMKAKTLYTMAGTEGYDATFEECSKAAESVIEMNIENYDAHYILAASLVARQMLSEAFEELKNTINLYGPRSDACKLQGYLCAKLNPPKYDLAVQNFDYLIQEHPDDLNMYLHRACAQVGRQNWDGVISDLSTVLLYQPKLTSVLNLRARAHCCKRNWSAAVKDYKAVLEISPDEETAYYALEEINRPIPDNPSFSGGK